MTLDDFDYDLPPELIAQFPASRRQNSRMLVLDRQTGACELRPFVDFVDLLAPGDCLVVNDTKVIPGRIFGHRPTGGRVELLLIEPVSEDVWHCLIKPGKRMRPGEKIVVDDDGATLCVQHRREDGTFEIAFVDGEAERVMARAGAIPLPPYIQRRAEADDSERYQTVYARAPGAVAAPTAGLHFTPDILAALEEKGVSQAQVTLHVGPGTFQPVKVDAIERHVMHDERYVLSAENAETINRTRRQGGRIVAVGTTSVRVLETCWRADAREVVAQTGRTRLFLHPPARPQAVDALLTNFHLPKSTLLMLVATFSSLESILAAYRLAVKERMRFYSYGDCMLLIDR